MLVLSKLISIKDYQPEIYAVIQEETDEIIAYAKTIGYLGGTVVQASFQTIVTTDH